MSITIYDHAGQPYEADLVDGDKYRALESELAALRRDRERLDWLEASPYRHVEGDYWDTGNPYWRCQDRKNVNTIACIGPDIRAAIDAARAEREGGVK